MVQDVIAVQPLDDYYVYLRFENGAEGVVDIAKLVDFTGVFAPLLEPTYFTQVYVNSELGTIRWPNAADIDPDVLYSVVTGEPLPAFERIYAR